jgi:streptogramin lyase
VALGCALALSLHGQAFEKLSTYRGLGLLVASTVGPGPTDGSQRFYLSYLYVDHTIDVVAVDPDTGEATVFSNPAPTESGARCMVAGPDGNIYLGTLPTAHILKLDPRAGTLTDLGRPASTEQYIWDLAFGPDGKLYGATYPQSKLVRYDPATGKMEDLGRMDSSELYAHYVAASDDGFVYVGIGTSKANIAAYQISTGTHKSILPSAYQTVAQATVVRAYGGQTYGKVGSTCFKLSGWSATTTSCGPVTSAASNVLADGRSVSVSGRAIRVVDFNTGSVTQRNFVYAGNTLSIFRLGFGPEGALYASSVLPIYLLRKDTIQGDFAELGGLGGGEIYSFLAHNSRLLAAAYSGNAPLMSFDPNQPFNQSTGTKNPALITYTGSDSGWRPQAMIAGPDGKVYLGPVAGYGLLNGPLTVWDPATNQVDKYSVVTDQSVVTLAVYKNLIVGGTTIYGGGGSHATQKEAKLFLWDPQARAKLFEMVPVAGAGTLNNLITAPNGLVYGMAGSTLFVFDPESRTVTARVKMPASSFVYNSIDVGDDGALWALASTGIVRIDPAANRGALVAASPVPITAGFARNGTTFYFASGAELWSWSSAFLPSLPRPPVSQR